MHKIDRKDISIIVTDFNRLQFISYALSSISKDSNAEVILVTNVDKDKINDNGVRITYIFKKGETYGDMVRSALQESKGNIICFLEDDDVFTLDKIDYIKKIFGAKQNLSYYHNSHFKIDDLGKKIGEELKKEKMYFNPFKNNHEVKRIMKRDVDHNLSSIVINKQYINTNELITLSRINLSVDTYIFAISLKEGTELIDDDKQLTGYRIHDSTSNPNPKKGKDNPFIRLHKLYAEDYKISSSITENPYFRNFLNCRYKIEKLYYSAYMNEHFLEDTICTIPCLRYLGMNTIKNRINMFMKEHHR
jgi:hypothetical protein